MMHADTPRLIFNASSEAKSLQADFGFRTDRGTRSTGAVRCRYLLTTEYQKGRPQHLVVSLSW